MNREIVLAPGEYLTAREVAEALGLSVQRVRVFIREGRLAVVRSGRLVYVRRADVERGVERKPRSGGRKAKARPPKRPYTKRAEHWRNGGAEESAARARKGKTRS